jgi:peptidyl-prolyl cis-trans isomerase-like 3
MSGTVYTCGRVIDGADTTLESMEKVPVNEKNRPLKEIKLLSVCSDSSCIPLEKTR